jgi:hypothetical protein
VLLLVPETAKLWAVLLTAQAALSASLGLFQMVFFQRMLSAKIKVLRCLRIFAISACVALAGALVEGGCAALLGAVVLAN